MKRGHSLRKPWLHIDGMIEDGEAIPKPSSLETVMTDRANRDGVAVLIDAPALADH